MNVDMEETVVYRAGDDTHVDLCIAPNVYALFCWHAEESWTAWGFKSDGDIFGQSIDNPPRVPAGSLQELLSSLAGYPERNL